MKWEGLQWGVDLCGMGRALHVTFRRQANVAYGYFSQVGQGSAPGGTCHNVTALSLHEEHSGR